MNRTKLKGDFCVKKRIIGFTMALVMCLGLAAPVLAAQTPTPDIRTIASTPSGMATWYIDQNNVLWASGGWSNGQHIMLGDGIAQRRTNYVRILDDVQSIAFINDGAST